MKRASVLTGHCLSGDGGGTLYRPQAHFSVSSFPL